MNVGFKVVIVRLLQYFETIFHSTVSRYLIKNFISGGGELHFLKWFSWTFLKSLDAKALLSLAGIASLTLISFPLGVWMGSFNTSVSFPITNLLNTAIGMFMIPFNIWTLSKTVNEMNFNSTVLTGVLIVEVASVIAVYGWYVIYTGSKP